jgi:hypothetical protein
MSAGGSARRRFGGAVNGGERRGGNAANSRSVTPAISSTASLNALDVNSGPEVTAATFLAYWSAAAWISSVVAGGSSPRSMVMFRHIAPP